jgi:hypothetical protein
VLSLAMSYPDARGTQRYGNFVAWTEPRARWFRYPTYRDKPGTIQNHDKFARLKEEGNALAGGVFQIVVGLVAIVFGFTAGEFYPAFIRRPRPDEKPMPKWLGRTIFAVVGVAIILWGLADLRHH